MATGPPRRTTEFGVQARWHINLLRNPPRERPRMSRGALLDQFDEMIVCVRVVGVGEHTGRHVGLDERALMSQLSPLGVIHEPHASGAGPARSCTASSRAARDPHEASHALCSS